MNIAILTRYTETPSGKFINKRYVLTGQFQEIASELGFNLIPLMPMDDYSEIMKITDGLIVPGSGTDVDPKHYGQPLDPRSECSLYDILETDRKAIMSYINSSKKVLGICAGLQELNVLLGGTLHQHIDNHMIRGETHPVTLSKDSKLYKMYGTDRISVSSTHHQCIDKLAPGVLQAALSDDGIIEAFEKDNILAVQWHPEALMDPVIFQHFFLDKA
ncbi:MAG: gamma-glutamyl-gamma-aminobutyrate hydrolase family protein [Erysipelotrichaceae bacterium]|nr:gamma-glutamyl-gamma-aminobutyrate hydrolase family protein [Erysipelotrichaceae bacterium]